MNVGVEVEADRFARLWLERARSLAETGVQEAVCSFDPWQHAAVRRAGGYQLRQAVELFQHHLAPPKRKAGQLLLARSQGRRGPIP